MTLFMDMHKVEGATPDAVAALHEKDLETQGRYGADFRNYWFDEEKGAVFCLIEAPSKEAAIAVHREAHGALADDILEVTQG